MEEYQAYSEIIKENIEYDALLQRNPYEKDAIQGIFDLILETVISNKASMTISGQEYPMNLVKSKFLKLNSSHIEYVLGCLGKNTTKVYPTQLALNSQGMLSNTKDRNESKTFLSHRKRLPPLQVASKK